MNMNENRNVLLKKIEKKRVPKQETLTKQMISLSRAIHTRSTRAIEENLRPMSNILILNIHISREDVRMRFWYGELFLTW